MFSFSLQFSSETFLIKRIQRGHIINLRMSSYKAPYHLSYFIENVILLTDFLKNTQITNFMRIPPMGSELFNADEDRVRDKQT